MTAAGDASDAPDSGLPPSSTAPDAPSGGWGHLWRETVIPVLIVLASLTGVLLTWWAASFGDQAGGNDRRAVLETALQAKNEARADNQVGYEMEVFARYLENQLLADRLDVEAQNRNLTPQGSAALKAEAAHVRQVGQDLAELYFDRSTYVDRSGRTFDEPRRRADLLRADVEASRVAPERTEGRALRFRERQERVVGFIVVLAVAVALLTVAQTTLRDNLRPWIAGVGTAVWVGAAAVAYLGDKA